MRRAVASIKGARDIPVIQAKWPAAAKWLNRTSPNTTLTPWDPKRGCQVA